MHKPLNGRNAFVTGSGRGLGRAIATRLAELGANIVVHDISTEAPGEFGEAASLNAVVEDITRKNVKAIAVTGDIAREADVYAMRETATAALGEIDILINCAGGDIAAKGGKPKPNNALGIPIEDIRAIMDRNLIGTMIVCRVFCPKMTERKRGSVVNIASVAAQFGVSDGVAYAVAKAGIVQFTRCLAKDLRLHGVRVNAISPGPTMTARFLATRAIDPAKSDVSVPLDRYGQPAEIADAVAYLAGDGARFVSGQVLCVDGGLCLFPS
jgi:3-oxoacyl-[acyl-carrier protein] reductase